MAGSSSLVLRVLYIIHLTRRRIFRMRYALFPSPVCNCASNICLPGYAGQIRWRMVDSLSRGRSNAGRLPYGPGLRRTFQCHLLRRSRHYGLRGLWRNILYRPRILTTNTRTVFQTTAALVALTGISTSMREYGTVRRLNPSCDGESFGERSQTFAIQTEFDPGLRIGR